MALLVLDIFSGLACLFLLFVLVQWMRETKRRPTRTTDTQTKDGKEVVESQALIAFPRKVEHGESRQPENSH